MPTTTVQEILQDNHLKHFVAPEETPVCKLEIVDAFKNLTAKEKLYAHHMSEASWAGTYIVLEQASRESVSIFDFLLDFFNALFKKTQTLTNIEFSKILGVSESVVSNFVQYASVFLGNMGNYKSFGDSKIIPRVEQEDVAKMVQNLGNASVALRFSRVKDVLYSLEKDYLELGFAESESQTTSSSYYSPNVTKKDAEFVQEFLKEKNISGINTRLFKSTNKEGQVTYELRIASAQKQLLGVHEYQGSKVVVSTGDFDYWLARVRDHLALAKKYAANEIQEQMLDRYVKHFDEGDLQEHVESQKLWVKDIGPVVETNIGFIESYRDPLHVRAEWEGFVACVNKETSRKFNELVAGAEKFIDMLPWNKVIEGSKPFEKDQFLKPDFTALEVLAFASSGIPAGINIPNYDDVRQNIGFKNVYLSNVVNAASPKEEITFLTAEDRELFTKLRGKAFEVQVGLHELLGHGSLKLLAEEKGVFNFDEKTVVNPITKQSVSTYYKTGETYYSKFSDISSSYEECRAEAVGIFLCVEDEVLKIFGHSGQDGADILFVNWLIMIRAGLLGLEFYSPESKKWLQAHMQARYVILKVLLEAGEGLVSLTQVGNDDLLLTLDRQKIKTVGIKAISDFLLKLGVYKSTGDVESARAMYNKYSEVSEEFLKYRSIVLSKKKPRRVFVQPRTEIDISGQVQLIEYDPSPIGIIQSFLARFPVV